MDYFPEEDYAYLQKVYINKIKHLGSWIWNTKLSDEELLQWLKNFKGEIDQNPEHEQLNALFLFKQYMFINIRELRQLLKTLYKTHFFKHQIQKFRHDYGMNDLQQLQNLYSDWLDKTRFIGIGNPSESSSLLLYFFRQINGLSKDLFWHTSEIFIYDDNATVIGLKPNKNGEAIENYIFLDDIIASGQQAIDFFTGVDFSIHIVRTIQHLNNNAQIGYYTLFNTSLARHRFKNELPTVQMKTIFSLDDTYKVYDPSSRYFPPLLNQNNQTNAHITERQYSEQICNHYFNHLDLDDAYKCGYRNSQLLLSFFYNTPDNTVPLFWAESEQWTNIMKRYSKLYF